MKAPKTAPRKPRPRFTDEAAERAYWERPESGADLDWSQAAQVRFPNLKP